MYDLLPKDKIGSGMGIYGTMNALGIAVAPAVGVALYEKAGYRASFLLAAGFAVLTSVTYPVVHGQGEAVLPSAAGGDSRTHKKPEPVDKKVIPIAVIIMLFAIPYCATQSFLVSYVKARQIPVAVSLFFPLYAVVLLLLRLSLRSLFDRKSFCFFMVLGFTSAFFGISLPAGMNGNITMFFAAAFMAGGYGMMCSVSRSTAILLAGKNKRGLANSTYYIGLDWGMSFGPMIGGLLFGSMDIRAFYPVLTATVPAGLIVYRLNRHKLAKK